MQMNYLLKNTSLVIISDVKDIVHKNYCYCHSWPFFLFFFENRNQRENVKNSSYWSHRWLFLQKQRKKQECKGTI